ncbi:MAG: hypothetical protein NWP87_01480 [Winogradskyella sp.]|nr:hypothetical protein [Winogradskyella sp.]
MINESLIEKYFSRTLTYNESLEFEKRYNTDDNFKQEVDFLKDVNSVSKIEDDLRFKNQLASYESEAKQKEKNIPKKWLKPLIAVAAILAISLSIIFLMKPPFDEEHLFSNYFEPSKNVSAPIVRSEDNENIVNKAFMAYSETHYKDAISLFENAYDNTNNSELLFYEGNAYLALDDLENAIAKFEEHLNYSDILTKRSHWYLALAYLKSKNLEKAKLELNALIKSEEAFKKEEAKSLLKE